MQIFQSLGKRTQRIKHKLIIQHIVTITKHQISYLTLTKMNRQKQMESVRFLITHRRIQFVGILLDVSRKSTILMCKKQRHIIRISIRHIILIFVLHHINLLGIHKIGIHIDVHFLTPKTGKTFGKTLRHLLITRAFQ